MAFFQPVCRVYCTGEPHKHDKIKTTSQHVSRLNFHCQADVVSKIRPHQNQDYQGLMNGVVHLQASDFVDGQTRCYCFLLVTQQMLEVSVAGRLLEIVGF